MSAFEAECPSCGHHLRLPAQYAGKTGKCPRCRETIQLPDVPASAPTAVGTPVEPTDAAPERPCPFCGETIKVAAKKCRHCGEFLDRSARRRDVGQPTREVPLVLRIWGIGIMALNVLGLGLQLLQMVAFGFLGVGRLGGGGAVLAGLAMGAVIGIVIYGVLIRLGWGLYKGQRSAVIGLCVLAALGLGVLVLLLATGAGVEAGVVLAILAVMYGPPIGVGFSRWSDLT